MYVGMYIHTYLTTALVCHNLMYLGLLTDSGKSIAKKADGGFFQEVGG